MLLLLSMIYFFPISCILQSDFKFTACLIWHVPLSCLYCFWFPWYILYFIFPVPFHSKISSLVFIDAILFWKCLFIFCLHHLLYYVMFESLSYFGLHLFKIHLSLSVKLDDLNHVFPQHWQYTNLQHNKHKFIIVNHCIICVLTNLEKEGVIYMYYSILTIWLRYE